MSALSAAHSIPQLVVVAVAGKDYGVGRERVRQLQCEAIAEARKVLG
jgi:hypothetical protein